MLGLSPSESLQCKMSWPAVESLDLEGAAAAAEELGKLTACEDDDEGKSSHVR